ncbi:MAG: hypothetical protein ACJ8J0_14300, partial [Longimicrobiaceae bacterium]
MGFVIDRSRISFVLALSTALGACGRESPREASPASASASCPSRPGGSRWASAGGEYRQAATYGQTPERWLYE